ncbi:MAG TPA: PKD domain-containing protein [Bacteroidales bacterium]|nr:PKD domain-containing protein [Bacteroidales bacterium]
MKDKYLTISICLILFLGISMAGAFAQVMAPTQLMTPIHYDVSRPLRDVEPIPPGFRERSWKDNLIKNKSGFLEEFKNPTPFETPDPVVQDFSAASSRDVTIEMNYDGVSNLNGVAPPDTDGDVGPNHYFQMINLSFAIWNKSGNLLYGPADNQTIWEGFDDGQPFDNNNDGDPIVLYDGQADRWLVSQFALNTTNDKYYELVAVSATPDPTGSWYRYAFEFTNMPDYPKFGIWRDGYYLSINQFANGSTWAGGGACVLNRDAMLTGAPTATMVFFSLGTGYGSLLPADCDGVFPPEGTPGYFVNLGTNLLRIWELSVNWTTPSNSTLTLVQTLSTASFTTSGISIAQKGVSQTLDALSDRLMFRLQYRKFGTYAVMLTNHTVKPDASSRAGVRWYELRKTGSTWAIFQQGTYAPSDGNSRWMGSIAMNGNGDIALGYSVSSSSIYPSIRFTGQTAANAGTGTMDIAETTIFDGPGSQSGVNRWGDYSMMSVDPTGDLKFWYTQEYSTGSWAWKTRIASFIFSTPPTSPPVADFIASPTTAVAGSPINFSDLSTNFPTSWNWTFTGGTPSSSTVKNPSVIYNVPGTYSVTLVATNGAGSDTETKTNYITITTPPPPVANFSASTTIVAPGGSVAFTDLSTNAPTSWSWVFEGGTPATSTLQNPTVTYSTYGTYDVSLTVTNGSGSDTESKTDYISVDVTYCASKGNTYTYEWISKVVFGSFTKSSGAAGYSNFTSDIIPVSAGNTYSITLTPGYSSTIYYEYWKVWIDFNHDGDFADSGENVFTANNVKNATSGSVTIPASLSVTTRMRVSMKYGGAPSYCETFTYGEVEDYTIQITSAGPPPVADFSASTTTIVAGGSVAFTDLSTNSPISWTWNFPGGTPSSSTVQNPTVTYAVAGSYSVTLTATNAGGSDSETRTNYITVTALPPVAAFTESATSIYAGQSIVFTDQSTNNPTVWNWTFEGGTPANSTVQNPTVTYATVGVYDVTLYVENSGGNSTLTKTDHITVMAIPAPVANFSGNPTSITTGGSVAFTDQSTNSPTSWAWTFEGGTPSTSTAQNPTVTYATAGTYDVTLMATNAGGTDSEVKTDYITVTDPTLVYCTSHGTASSEWISKVQIGSTYKSSGSSGSAGYQDFTSFIFNLTMGISNTITLTPGYPLFIRYEYWRVWIDYNHDGDFTDTGEQVVTINNKRNAVSTTFTVPTSALNGQTRMRVSVKRSSGATSCQIYSYGEVEDYTVNISSGLAPIGVSETSDFQLNVYPNPADEMLYIRTFGASEERKELKVYNSVGLLVETFILDQPFREIDISAYRPGMYIISVSTSRFLKQQKVIIQ